MQRMVTSAATNGLKLKINEFILNSCPEEHQSIKDRDIGDTTGYPGPAMIEVGEFDIAAPGGVFGDNERRPEQNEPPPDIID